MGTEADTRRIAALAARQSGVVTRGQLRALGITARVVHRLLAQGHLHRVHTGVFAVGHPALTLHGRWLATTLALGPGAMLSHRAAAVLWGILPSTGPLDVSVPTTAGARIATASGCTGSPWRRTSAPRTGGSRRRRSRARSSTSRPWSVRAR
jgi:Transcriptional regulator, AbiEi antitoxin